jgi:hypothetical protein
VKFTVTYWEHRRMTAVADERDVESALLGYLEDNIEFGDTSKLARARVTLDKVRAGTTPTDLDIISEALRGNGFDAPEGTKPTGWDTHTDYAVVEER